MKTGSLAPERRSLAGWVFRFRGAMVDGPVLRHAAEVIRRAELDGPR